MDLTYIIYIIASILVFPVMIYAISASYKVNSTFRKYSSTISSTGLTAGEVARRILDREGLGNVQIGTVPGNLTDNFNPADNTVYLSESVSNNRSLSAIGVAAHECGHAIQHARGYIPTKIRTAIVPAVNFGSRLAFPLLLIGLFVNLFTTANSLIGTYILIAGIILYSLSTLFMLITLPSEFNASSRAKKILANGILSNEEVDTCGVVLKAAASTYVAAFAVSLIQLIRIAFMFLGGNRRNRK